MSWLTLFLVLLLVALAAAVKFLPWWALLIGAGLLGIGWKYIGALILWFWMRRVAKELGNALRGATFAVHAIQAVPPPDAALLKEYEAEDAEDMDDESDESDGIVDEPPQARCWYVVELTIQPALDVGDDSQGWDADALMLVEPVTAAGEISIACRIAKLDFIEPERTVPRQGHMCFGPCRLKFLIGTEPGIKQLVFRYMFIQQLDGVIELPAPAEVDSTSRA